MHSRCADKEEPSRTPARIRLFHLSADVQIVSRYGYHSMIVDSIILTHMTGALEHALHQHQIISQEGADHEAGGRAG